MRDAPQGGDGAAVGAEPAAAGAALPACAADDRAPPSSARPPRPSGQPLRIAGIVVGVAGLGALAAGIGLGAAALDAQNKLSSLATQHGQLDAGAGEPLPVAASATPPRRPRSTSSVAPRVATGVVLYAVGWRRDRARFAVAPDAGRRRAGGLVVRVLALRRARARRRGVGGCIFAPKLGDGAIACGSDGSCPPGQGCGADDRCHVGARHRRQRLDASVPCTPIACADVGRNCGPLDDGCGNTLDCGSVHGARHLRRRRHRRHVRLHASSRARDQHKDCGAVSNGCGATVSCGSCALPNTCGGGGPANVCGCTPKTLRADGQELRQRPRRLRRHHQLRHAGRLSRRTDLRRRRRRPTSAASAPACRRRALTLTRPAATSPTAAR